MFLNFNNVIKMRIFKGNPELATQRWAKFSALSIGVTHSNSHYETNF
jgi:hypothetical protein